MKKVSIIIPVYNESKTLGNFYHELEKYQDEGIEYEIVFVDDGSVDDSLKIIKKYSNTDSRIRYISLKQNYGQQTALFVGLKYCSGHAAIVLDCDLQDPPSLIPQMIEKWRNGDQIVLPVRLSRKDKKTKILFAKIFYKIVNIFTSTKISHNIGEFYLIDRRIINQMLSNIKSPLFLRGLVQKIHAKKSELRYHREARQGGQSAFTFKKMIMLAYDGFVFTICGKCRKTVEYNVIESNIFSQKSVAIIGGGFLGLTTAYYLSLLGMKVTLYEENGEVGGLLAVDKFGSDIIEKYYHHIFTGDINFRELIKKLNLSDKLKWHSSNVAVLRDNKLFPFNGAADLIKLPNMNLWQKFRLGTGSLFLSRKPIGKIKHVTAKEIIERYIGSSSWQKFWYPMFSNKFANYADKISAAWFIGRLQNRSSSRQKGRQKLGYIDGSFGAVIDRLKEEIKQNGSEIITNKRVWNIEYRDKKYQIFNKSYDICVSTLAPSDTEKVYSGYKTNGIEYIGFIGIVVVAKKTLSPFYWINVMDNESLFGVIVEQSNLVSGYKNHYIYLGRYIDPGAKFFNQSEEETSAEAKKWLERIKKGFSRQIIEIRVYKEKNAQPIILPNYRKPRYTAKTPGFYTSSMAHIFPQDRALENAIKEAKKIVKMLIQ